MKREAIYRPGERIAGRFLVHEVKKGGMGEVYLCLDEQETLPLALKTVRREWWASPKAWELFEREVGTWVSLGRHANIVRCYLLATFDERPFMVLEWVASEFDQGASLREWLQLRGPPELRTALDLAIDIVRGLEYAQQQAPGIVHRDLKPENVLVGGGPLAKVSDFGLARVADGALGGEAPAAFAPEATRSTGAGAQARTWWRRLFDATSNAQAVAPAASDAVALSVHGTRMHGTPPYMAPEQWLGHRLDARTDIYAFGCLLHELLTGRPPYVGSEAQLRASHLHGLAPRPSQLPRVPAEVGRIVERCLQKAPEHRPATHAELLKEVEAVYLSQFGELARAAPVGEALSAVDHKNRGASYHELRRYEEALAAYGRAIEMRADDAMAYSNRGLTYAALQLYDEALADYARAIELRPALAEAYNNRGLTYDAQRRYDKALADYARALELRPAYAKALFNRANTYLELQHHAEALADYGRAIELRPADADAHCNRGKTYAELQRYGEALADYTRAIQLRPVDAEAQYNRAVIYTTLQRYHDALADYTRAIELRPHFVDAYVNRGFVYGSLERYDEALADFARATELSPADAMAYFNRGNIYAALRRYDEALADYTHAIELRPGHAATHNNKGALFAELGAFKLALPCFEKAAQLGHPLGARNAAIVRERLQTQQVIPSPRSS